MSVTRIVKLNVPSAEGVPVITPPDERLNPPGKDPEANDHVYGDVPPFAVNVWSYDTPTIPDASGELVVIESGATIVRLKAF